MAGGSLPEPLRPLAAALVAIFGLAAHAVSAAPAVTNCNDSGPGSLRASVTGAADIDTVDATQLACSTISLTTGAILVGQSSLTIDGPGSDKLTIDGTNNAHGYNILAKLTDGMLAVNNLTMAHSYFYAATTKYFGGGCVFSAGNLSLDHVVLTDCSFVSGKRFPRGGAAYAHGDLSLTNSTVTGSLARGTLNAFTYYPYTHFKIYYSGQGGGVFAKGNVLVDHSTIAGNLTMSDAYPTSVTGAGGGVAARGNLTVDGSTIAANISGFSAIYCFGSLTMTGSTISGNHAGAAVDVQHNLLSPANQSMSILNSTISGNRGTALYTNTSGSIYNSTIAFNTASAGTPAAVGAGQAGTSLVLDSSIIADNYPADLAVKSGAAVAAGAYSIIKNSSVAVPGATSVCPLLEPLADNGGPTQTHALRHTSPAIDSGSNPHALQYDQRGSGYARVYGSKADVGAFEWQGGADETVFGDGFDGPRSFCELRL